MNGSLTRQIVSELKPGRETDRLVIECLPLGWSVTPNEAKIKTFDFEMSKVVESSEDIWKTGNILIERIPDFSPSDEGALRLYRMLGEIGFFCEITFLPEKNIHFARFAKEKGKFVGEGKASTLPEAVVKAALNAFTPYQNRIYECVWCKERETVRIHLGEEKDLPQTKLCIECGDEMRLVMSN